MRELEAALRRLGLVARARLAGSFVLEVLRLRLTTCAGTARKLPVVDDC
jgi:hypothetical protein